MSHAIDINLDGLIRSIHALCPALPDNEELDKKLRLKLQEQLHEKIPRVELEQLDLKFIISNAQKSLSDIQRRIDDSVAQQQLRRTTSVRKTTPQELATGLKSTRKTVPALIENRRDINSSCTKEKCCDKEYELQDLVQVESLPVSASTNLLTIFVPSILQEKLHSCKYKISIDLNRLDLTKKILDLNVGQLEIDPNDGGRNEKDLTNKSQSPKEIKLTYELKNDNAAHVRSQETGKHVTEIEVKSSTDNSKCITTMKPTVSIVQESSSISQAKKRGQKRKTSKLSSNNPPKKRGRKPGSKNKPKNEKSELAKYVEMFECSGKSPSSAFSQNVTSTTQPWELVSNQVGQIAYFMNGEWTLCDTSHSACHLVSTSNINMNMEDTTGQEPSIPFDDFVNYIDNPSLDVVNNVIAQVLHETTDTAQVVANTKQKGTMETAVDINQASKNVEKVQAFQFSPSNAVVANSSYRETNISFNFCKDSISNVLDLKKETVNKQTSSEEKESLCSTENNVIFSISHDMPTVDDEDVDSICSTPHRMESSQSIVVYSVEPETSQLCVQKHVLSPRKAEPMESESDFEKNDRLHSTYNSFSSDITGNSKIIPIPSKVKRGEEVIKEMSLLEIEKDFDNSLMDLNSYLDDDLLSLAPSSCFNSPVEDRFADSKYSIVEDSQTKSCINIEVSKGFPVSAPRSHLEAGVLKCKEDELNAALKNFKIPKMTITSNLLTEQSSEKLSVEKFSKTFDKGNISILTDSCSLSTKKSIELSKPVSSAISSYIVSTLEISKIFGSICFGFLADMCFESDCKHSHQFLNANLISTSVSLLRNEVLHSAYRFIWRHSKLFKLYFPIFCQEYGRRNMRRKLSSMVYDCQLQPMCLPFLLNVLKTLPDCGYSRVNACRFILRRVNERSNQAINVLLQLIIESDAQMFVSTIEEFSNVEGYKFQMKAINELTKACLRPGNTGLIPALIKCLINVDQAEFLTMRSPELIQLLEMIKNSGKK